MTPAGKPRARALGIEFDGEPGPWNAITDIAGVEVGHATVVQGEAVRTGVTAVHPRGRARPHDPCAAGIHVLNGNGEMTGRTWVEESGSVALPITLTTTAAVGVAHAATVAWIHARAPAPADTWFLPVAAETWDGYLNDANGGHVTKAVVWEALDAARSGPVEEGSVGGGTGMCCYGFKGGCGTASRRVGLAGREFTVGVHVQANFGSRHELVVAGAPVGPELLDDDPMGAAPLPPGAGSVIVILATDAPLLPGQCAALARRVPLGLARTGTVGSHYSGDIFLAFSTANSGVLADPPTQSPDNEDPLALFFLPWGRIDLLYAAAVQAVEEAVLNAMIANAEMVGREGRRVPALPREKLCELLEIRGRGSSPP